MKDGGAWNWNAAGVFDLSAPEQDLLHRLCRHPQRRE